MNLYIQSNNTDPCHNLALEQFVFDSLDRRHNYIMLWRNNNAIIVGKHQNTGAEINPEFIKTHNISVVRRLSGGGAVYHDLGNLNFTFICDADKNSAVNFAEFLKPIQSALISFGVPVEISGRNDMTIEGKKISGNAQYIKNGRILHHGTLLYDSNLEILSQALQVSGDKIESKGIKSVKSRVANIRPYMKKDLSINEFWSELTKFLQDYFGMKDYYLSESEENEVNKLAKEVYSQWNWNYGASPPHNIRKTRRVEGCGAIEILLDVAKEGIIQNIAFYGDFFGAKDTAELAGMLQGRHLEYSELKAALAEIDVSQYFHALDQETFLALMME